MRLRLEYRPQRLLSPLTPFVHVAPEEQSWQKTEPRDLRPPLPEPILGKGFPVWIAEHKGHEIWFVSQAELQHAIDVLGQRNLPRSRDLGRRYGAVNTHWLSRLQKTWKPWAVRKQLVAVLSAALK